MFGVYHIWVVSPIWSRNAHHGLRSSHMTAVGPAFVGPHHGRPQSRAAMTKRQVQQDM